MLQSVAEVLNPFNENCIYVGGSITELYINTDFAGNIRPTMDVDIAVNIITRKDYYKFEEELRNIGLKNDISENAPICRWIYYNIKIDIMPVEEETLGFTNQWYQYGFERKIKKILPNKSEIYILPLELYIASKLEATINRGLDDIRISHDLEDIIFLLINTKDIVSILKRSDEVVKLYLNEKFQFLKNHSDFEEAVSWLLPYGFQNGIALIEEVFDSIIVE